MIKRKFLILSLLQLVWLTGCSVMNSDYDCPLQDTASCDSLSVTDKKITYGLVRENRADAATQDNKFYVTHRGLMPKAYPKRVPEMTSRIWFAPYEDQNGNFIDASYVYVVTKDSSWAGKPVKPKV